MLFLIHKPTNLSIGKNDRMVLTTSHQIIFTSLHFIEEFVSKELLHTHTNVMHFSEQSSEALLASTEDIQIYWTDWHSRIEFRLFISLHHEPIYSIVWRNSWEIYGGFKQYSPDRVKLFRVQSYYEDFQSCFIGSQQFVFTNKRLVCYNHYSKQLRDIQWAQSEVGIKMLNAGEMSMKGVRKSNGGVALSISNFCLLIEDNKVIKSICNDGELSISQDIAIWINSQTMVIYQIGSHQIVKLGSVAAFQGDYLGCSLVHDKLALVFYDLKELKVNFMRLVQQQQNFQNQDLHWREPQHQPKTIMEQAQQCFDQQKYHNPSTTLSDSKQNLWQSLVENPMLISLKAEVEKFQEELHRSQQEIQSAISQNQREQPAMSHQLQDEKEENMPNEAQIGSLGIVTQQMDQMQGFLEGESCFEWQKMESKVRSSISLV